MTTRPNGAASPALTIQSIGVNRTEGIDHPFRLDNLGPGINLVHGPNGVGKSRTAAAIQALIWPDRSSQRSEFLGRLALGEDIWHVDVEGLHARYQRNGGPSGAPELSGIPSSQRDRYLLTLHDLLHADNPHFARTIQNEAAGGYDLNAIRQEMRLGSPLKVQAARPKKAHQAAREATESLRRRDLTLQSEERSLQDVNKEFAASVRAGGTVRLLESAREYVDALDELREARIRRDAFEDPVGSMTGDEYLRVTTLQEELREQTRKLQHVELELARFTRDLEETGFADLIPEASVLAELRQRLGQLRDRENDLRQAGQEIASHEASAASFRARIADSLTEDQLLALDSDGLRQLSTLTRDYQGAESRANAQSELLAWLGTTTPPSDLDILMKGTAILERRLRIGDADSDSSPTAIVKWALLGAAFLIVVESLLLAISVAPALGAIAAAAIPLVWTALRVQSTPATAIVENLRAEFDHLGLDAPTDWTPASVRPVLDSLQERLATARLEQQKAERWANLSDQRARAAEHARKLEEKREELLRALGVAPEGADPEAIRQVATALDNWRQATDALTKCRAAAVEAQRERDAELAAINVILIQFDRGDAENPPRAHALIEQLAHRTDAARDARLHLESFRRQRDEQVQPAIDRLLREIDGVYTTLGLDTNDELKLTSLCERVPFCRDSQKQVDEALVKVDTARARLADVPGYFEKSREEIELELAFAQELSAKQGSLQKRISDIEAQLQQAKRQSQLEEAIACEASAFDDLHESRQRDYQGVAGWNVLEFIQGQHRTRNRPAVLDIAEDLFSSFTSGSYRLEIGDDNQPEFRAIDTTTQRGLGLDELSSGTRVQLLLAVRLAFIQAVEQGPQLPIILDETLGNTDDVRAGAIIDAAIEITRRGRQVIYFTAQLDEVAKWKSRIDQHSGIPDCQTFNLATIRGREGASLLADISWDPSSFLTEHIPDGIDYYSARSALAVAPVDLTGAHVDGVDLWYVITDVDALRTLRSRAVRTWGQYRQLYHGGRRLPEVGPAGTDERAMVRALVIDTVRESWQHGRPRRISRQGLGDCGLITDRFLDEVFLLCEELEGDCQSLLQALRDRRVSGFRVNVIEQLEDYFRENRFITEVEPFSDEIIFARAVTAAQGAIDRGIITESEIGDLLRHLGTIPTADLDLIGEASGVHD